MTAKSTLLVKNRGVSSIEELHTNSKCQLTKEEFAYLKSLLKDQNLILSQLFIASEDGWSADDYRDICVTKKVPKLFLIRIHDGSCIGGFTSSSSKEGAYMERVHDEKAFLFNLTEERIFPCQYPEAAFLDDDNGPWFGSTEELRIEFGDENKRAIGTSESDKSVY